MRSSREILDRYLLRKILVLYQKMTMVYFKVRDSKNLSGDFLNSGNNQQDNNGFMTAYFGNVEYLFRKCQKLSFDKIENFVDIGSGDGSVAFFMSRRYRHLSCVGIEIDAGLHTLAIEYLLNGPKNLKYAHESALDWDFRELRDGVTVIFFFNSFGEGSLNVFLDNLDRFCKKHRSKVYFIYLNDLHAELLTKRQFLKLYSNVRKQSIWLIGENE
jgi:ubiquinone/menaquinone biosynthesis C-methylase UbiE